MKILMLSLYYPYPLDKGSNIRIYNLLGQLARNHELDLITFAAGGNDPNPGLRQLERYCASVQVIPLVDGRHGWLDRLAAFASPYPRSLRLSYNPLMARAIAAQCRRTHYQLILVEWLWLAHYVADIRDVPLVLDDHNAETAMFRRALRAQGGPLHHRLRGWLTWLKVRNFERSVIKRFSRVICVSASDRDELARLSRTAPVIDVIPNGVDVDTRPFQAWPVVEGQLIYSGSLTYSPNLDACIYFVERIFPRVLQRIPGVTLMITGHLPASVPDVLRTTPGVRLVGYVDDIACAVGSSALCVVPLRHGGGTRLKILEAMALGVPVVSTSVGAEGIHVTDGQNILLADTPSRFAQQVVDALCDDELRQRLAVAARDLVEREYSWRVIGVHLEATLRRVAEDAPAPRVL